MVRGLTVFAFICFLGAVSIYLGRGARPPESRSRASRMVHVDPSSARLQKRMIASVSGVRPEVMGLQRAALSPAPTRSSEGIERMLALATMHFSRRDVNSLLNAVVARDERRFIHPKFRDYRVGLAGEDLDPSTQIILDRKSDLVRRFLRPSACYRLKTNLPELSEWKSADLSFYMTESDSLSTSEGEGLFPKMQLRMRSSQGATGGLAFASAAEIAIESQTNEPVVIFDASPLDLELAYVAVHLPPRNGGSGRVQFVRQGDEDWVPSQSSVWRVSPRQRGQGCEIDWDDPNLTASHKF